MSTTDAMTFEGGTVPPLAVEGREKYFLNPDGGPGDYFIETAGQTHRMVRVGEGVWNYAAPATTQELGRLGFPGGAAGRHVLVKVVTQEQGAEAHRVSRLTTVRWKDQAGKERTLQFVSLQGSHTRKP